MLKLKEKQGITYKEVKEYLEDKEFQEGIKKQEIINAQYKKVIIN